MKNAHQDGRVLDVTLTEAVKSGGVIVQGKLVAVAVTDGQPGDTIAAHVEGVFRLPKLAAAAFSAGGSVNWDTPNGLAISAAAGADQVGDIGYAVADADAGGAEVLVRLTPGSAAAGA